MAFQVDNARVSSLIEDISLGSRALSPGNVRALATLQEKARSLCQALETPQETMLKLCLLQNTIQSIIQIGFDLQLFGLLPEEEDKAIGSAELAQKAGAERSLLVRILNHLVASGLVNQSRPDRFHANPLTTVLASEKTRESFHFYGTTMVPALALLPQYLAEQGYRDPRDEADTPLQRALGTELHAFEYIRRDPALARGFRSAVLSQEHLRRAHWADPEFYPVRERLLSGLRDDQGGVVVVDVGGGIGLDLIGLDNAHPERRGAKLVLQDTEQVLSSASVPSSIEKMPHNFFEPQPVRGARAYYFHRVFHDWSDEKCREILLALRPAMAPGYSRVLVQDNVVPARGASPIQTASDLIMMCGFCGRERFEADFRALFASVGMEVTGIWTRSPGEESVVEAMVLVE